MGLASKLDRGGNRVTLEYGTEETSLAESEWESKLDDKNQGEVKFNREYHQEPCLGP